MSAHVSGLEIMNEDQLIKEVLDKFLNCHEQTNDEEFLNTFAHRSQEDLVSERGVFGTDSSENIFTSAKVTHKNEANNCHLRNKTIFLRTSSQCLEEQVNNFLDLEDLDMDEEIKPQMSEDLLLLPGEVEQAASTSIPPCIPSVAQPPTCEVKPKPAVKRMDKQTEEILGDEVQPFSLDEEFDYDNVTLTSKFSPAEIETIKELCKQKRKDTSPDLEEPCD
ncbi:intraflagellar transport-associated protein [Macaca thibetana thibetana]|uniref:Intraflagellar transport associated protein n=3 Tax=Macaca TaxID=9539 RepID=F7HMD1_MACMU|nr:intraflagellar transport-associated protein [Macaca mulatta]XP_005578218.2 intraflagellar transport-associated protein isoform X1 [Macaca fascicularis]XP_005578219.2 intraflagellar transport-associated protein isoform X1 [Macaca fascicularis]XP_005578221.2 intraflagellar transport-associated protein isoform X1 [Macaca fascicularis]XP_005578222.2 intraflagellar transport-associated protein isoform X1 [Macaca fascicularis]XP_005578223.2 intraflagellar transport-associated protein isoform X1 [